MTDTTIAWPRKTRELMNHHMDSTVWNDFAFRGDDIVVATYAKSGTTWTQQILGQLVFGGDPGVAMSELSPWLDLRVPPKPVKLGQLEAQAHRRVVKTHLPLDALVFEPDAKYLYIGRDGRDVLWSLHNHHSHGNALWYELLNDTPGRVGPPIDPPDPDIRRYFLTWLERDGYPFWSLWDNVTTWWAARVLPNVKLVHFNDLKADLAGQMRRIADFLDIAVPQDRWPAILEHCSFDWMKAHAAQVAPLGGAIFDGGGEAFINKGTNGRWRDVLTADDIDLYERVARARLGVDCARWLAEGGPAV
ncbi:sulfotransferase domain-containing protein [Caulobacter sp. KR2-114]|uniref:sulfotransferase domain-containing protein n=1 Tax=Caulobacter sp. KR2-114 TaxID=3400912 RepID=UPI003C0AEECC